MGKMGPQENAERNARILELAEQNPEWTSGQVAEQIEAEGFGSVPASTVRGHINRARKRGEISVPKKLPGGHLPKASKGKRRRSKAKESASKDSDLSTVRVNAEGEREERLTVWLPADVARDLRVYAAARRTTMTATVAAALRDLFEREPPIR